MSTIKRLWFYIIVLIAAAPLTAVADPPVKIAPVPPELAGKGAPNWSQSEFVFSAKLDQVVAGPVGRSFPPMYTHTLHFTVEKVLRGGLKPGEKVVCSHAARQNNPPAFPEGKVCLVAARKTHGGMIALTVQEADDDAIAAATATCSLPLGWTMEGGKPVSPWAAQDAAVWPAGLGARAKVKCSKTGRPALMAGPSVTLAVEPVPPEKAIQWTNPDGDGLYKITATNTTNEPAKVPALLSDGKNVLWEDSLVILCQGKPYVSPGSKGVAGRVQPAEIPAGGSVSAVVNVLRLDGPEWPRGGYRIEFQFCLGEKSQTKSFYYMSRHHDPLREAAHAGGVKGPPTPAPTPTEEPEAETPDAEKPAAGATAKVMGSFVIPKMGNYAFSSVAKGFCRVPGLASLPVIATKNSAANVVMVGTFSAGPRR
jgi:hypothetical protein